MRAIVVALMLVFCVQAAQAIDAGPAFEDPALQARYERLGRELRCLQCRSETIFDSNASLAVDLRRQLRELIAEGKSDDEIMQYMTDRYSDYVRYKPPLAPRTVLLWAAPILLVLGGVGVAITVILRKSRLPEDDPVDPGLGAS
ncbi:MAG: cytochrome c-type biogenesis protein CcmH [Xanthomonadaceae bacterium]|nr:cytochrome c-type biogenesis protein CcmH [Xanthomonadaceae bacterium]